MEQIGSESKLLMMTVCSNKIYFQKISITDSTSKGVRSLLNLPDNLSPFGHRRIISISSGAEQLLSELVDGCGDGVCLQPTIVIKVIRREHCHT